MSLHKKCGMENDEDFGCCSTPRRQKVICLKAIRLGRLGRWRVMCGGRIIGKLQRDFVENGRGEAVKLGSTAVFSVEI